MKSMSIGQQKGTSWIPYNPSPPREGTKIRRYYDLLMANKGRAVIMPRDFVKGQSFERLLDTYGLDIRCMKTRKYEYCLVGEWFGKVYIDYVVNK